MIENDFLLPPHPYYTAETTRTKQINRFENERHKKIKALAI